MVMLKSALFLSGAILAAASPLYDLRAHGPDISFQPHAPFKPMPTSQARTKVCNVKSTGGGQDDSQNFLEALHKCNDGGRVVLGKGKQYTIGTALNLTFLRHIDIDVQGKVLFTDDTDYWQQHSFKYAFQNASSFFKLGGEDVNVYGGGELNGNGMKWWKMFHTDKNIIRPNLFTIEGLIGGSVSNLTLRDSPMWVNLIMDSKNVVYDNLQIQMISEDPEIPAKNTDGWDTYRSDNIVIQNCHINNGDDCVAFKPNSTNILVQNLFCNGSHGISVGSLGQYKGTTDIVENIGVYNIDMNNASDGARIKVFPGAIGSATDQGGGLGYVKNVTYENVHNNNNDWAIEVTQCYAQKNQTLCNEHPSSMTFEDILFKNFTGTTSGKNSPDVATLVCSNPKQCSNIRVKDFNVKSQKGGHDAICTNVNKEDLDLQCKSG